MRFPALPSVKKSLVHDFTPSFSVKNSLSLPEFATISNLFVILRRSKMSYRISRSGMRFLQAKGLLQSRWMMLVASFFIMSCAGALYSYSIYSSKLKTVLKYDQETVNTIGFFKDLGANIGVIAGILYDFTGAWPVLLLGAIFNVFGYIMTWLSVTERIARPEVWQMCLYLWVGASSGAFVSTAVIVTCVKNFPRNRGIVIGLLKGFVGLSGAMLTQVYRAIYGDNPTAFILVVAWFPAGMFLLFMFYIRPLPADEEKNELKKFYIFLGTSLILAFFLLAVILAQNLTKVHRPTNIALMVIMILILALPVLVVFQSESGKWKAMRLGSPEGTQMSHIQNSEVLNGDLNGDKDSKEKVRSTESGKDVMKDDASDASDTAVKSMSMKKLLSKFYKELRYRPKRGDDYTILQALTSIDLWIVFIATTAGLGSGLMAIDNLGQIGSSLGYSQHQVTTFQSLLSIWNFFGRVGFGFISEICMQRYGVPRPFFLSLILGIMSFGHLYLGFALPGALYLGSILIGMCFGGTMSVVFAIISEVFGLKYFGTLYNVGILASPLGTYLLSVRVAGTLYDSEARKQHGLSSKGSSHAFSSKSDLDCHGSICYRNTFIIMAACCFFGCIISLILSIMTMKFYKSFRAKASDPENEV